MTKASDSKLPFQHISIDNQKHALSQNFRSKHSFSKCDLERCANGRLFGAGNAKLPTPPLMMLDRIIDIQSFGGKYGRGYAIAEMDVKPNDWFFNHHFHGDPVMPGFFLIESLWQLTGFHMAWAGRKGKGRVLESGRTRFLEPVSEKKQTLIIAIHLRKTITNVNPICISNGEVRGTDSLKCKSDAIKVGLFQ